MTTAPHKFYVYAVITKDVEKTPELLAVRTSRQLARTFVEQSMVRDDLRVRRGKLTLFET